MQLQVIGCMGAYPHDNTPTSSYLLTFGQTHLLLDIGSGALLELDANNLTQAITHLFISHFHEDHCADLGPFIFHEHIHDLPLKIYAPSEPKLTSDLGKKIDFFPIDKDKIYFINEAELRFHSNLHRIETYSLRISYRGKDLVYTADTELTPSLIDFCHKADLLLMECSGYQGEDAAAWGHMNADECYQLFTQSQSKKGILTHLPFYGNHQDLLKPFKDLDVILAYKGLKVGL